MKQTITLFSGTYLSSTSGTVVVYLHELPAADVLGQAKSLRCQVICNRRTGSNTRAKLRFFESAKPGDARPSQWGKEIGTGTIIDDAAYPRPAIFNVTGPFLGRVECILEIYDQTAAALQEFELEVHITAIMEE